MEQQGVTLRVRRLAVIVDASYLARSYEEKCPFLIVVFVASVSNGPVDILFQEDGVETETFAAVFQYVHFRKVHKTHKRIERFQPQELVVVVYRLQIQNFSHTCPFLVS